MSSRKATECHQQGLEPKITEVGSARFTKNAGFKKLTYLLPKMVGEEGLEPSRA